MKRRTEEFYEGIVQAKELKGVIVTASGFAKYPYDDGIHYASL
ncbi:hypothetical protein T4A_4094 [Trichinella pseudospiralis]|uniref:Uncharacterized protein n=1 Tax=Trichinella pseudospiralis TaxID=6337 RepID=A0A0V1DQN0_TRIPS|nr:hypothetical protein T4A_4094 [Trichinella pseudospiralis]KRY98000.1 hypothetical protein T4C_5725 [Trichinella pseudospiralis]